MQAAAFGAVIPHIRRDADDKLAGLDEAGDDPIDGTAIQDVLGALGDVAGLVAQRRVALRPLALDGFEMGDVADADGEFDEVENNGL